MKLHIGGESIKDGWKILNIQPKEGIDFIGSITDLSQFTPDSFNEVYASHVFEHIMLRDALKTLRGIYRILKPTGKLYLSVPDLDILCRMFIEPSVPNEVKIHVTQMIFGGHLDNFDTHYMGWSSDLPTDFLKTAGFCQIQRVEEFGIFTDTSTYKPYGIPISLNIIAAK